MSGDAAGQDFVLTVLDVFRLAGGGTTVTGRVGSGALRTGETVEILDGGSLVATARATVEMITSTAGPRKVSLLLADVDASLLGSGQIVRRLRHGRAPAGQLSRGTGTPP
jgi:translation elongation factor EF-Tu-like GTPase